MNLARNFAESVWPDDRATWRALADRDVKAIFGMSDIGWLVEPIGQNDWIASVSWILRHAASEANVPTRIWGRVWIEKVEVARHSR